MVSKMTSVLLSFACVSCALTDPSPVESPAPMVAKFGTEGRSADEVAAARIVAVLGGREPPSALQERVPYYSKFGDQVLSRSTAVVRGTVVAVSDAATRLEVVRVDVAQTFKGAENDEVVLLANRGEYFEDSELLLFLAPYEGGPRYTCFNHISTTDPDYEAKVDHLERQIHLEAQKDDSKRMELARSYLLQTAESDVEWARWSMMRELAYVLRVYPEMIRDEDAEKLADIAKRSDNPRFQRELLGLLKKREEGFSDTVDHGEGAS